MLQLVYIDFTFSIKEEFYDENERLLAASALCAMTLALAACGGKKEAAKSGGAWKPEKDIHVIVAYKAGSGTDTGARILCKDAENILERP